MNEYKYYIAGEFKDSKEKIPVINPANREEFECIFEAPENDLSQAIQKAKDTGKKWKETSFSDRAKVLREIAKAILDNVSIFSELETKEIGKPLKESLFVDIPLSADCFNYYATFLETLKEEKLPNEKGIDLVKYDPFGVVGVYLPYNVPLMIFGFSCAAALAAGNALIIKPSEYASLSILELVKHLDKLDIPKGLINVVTGKGAKIGSALARSEVDLISFTGSRNTLKKIIAQSADNPKKIVCELGGCNLSVIFNDADKEEAMQNLLAASFMKQGQICIGASLALIQEDIYEDFVKDLIERVGKIKVGDPFLPDTGLGALPSKEHLDRVQEKVDSLVANGAKILCGASTVSDKGFFYPPMVIELQDIVYEELFAPVVMVKRFKDEKEIEKYLDNNPTGLVLQLWTKNDDLSQELSKKAHCGTVWINTFVQMNSSTPFGGAKQSGWGRNLGSFGFFEYIQPKHIGIGTNPSPVVGWFGV